VSAHLSRKVSLLGRWPLPLWLNTRLKEILRPHQPVLHRHHPPDIISVIAVSLKQPLDAVVRQDLPETRHVPLEQSLLQLIPQWPVFGSAIARNSTRQACAKLLGSKYWAWLRTRVL
jgi:hypothetical protein